MQSDLWSLAVSGAGLGLWAGVAPGPMLALVVSETLLGGTRAGAKVAAAPLITDAPIIALTLFFLAGLSSVEGALGLLSFVGAAVLLWMAWDTWTAQPPDLGASPANNRSLRKGIVTNLVNPHPYLFWVAVGGPLLIAIHEQVPVLGPALFLAAFYAMLVGAKLLVAVVAGRSRTFLSGPAYGWLLKGMALMLAVFGVLFVRDGLRLVGA